MMCDEEEEQGVLKMTSRGTGWSEVAFIRLGKYGRGT